MTGRSSDDVATELGPKGALAPPTAVAYRITVVSGADANVTVTLDPSTPRVLVGTSSACQLVLTDRQVSRRHAAFDAGPMGLRVTDLGSTNGTRVDSLAVVDAWLVGGETVRIGSTVLRVEALQGQTPARLTSAVSFGRLLGASVAMRRLYPMLEHLAASTVPVVIEGESGTGKELAAEALHEMGPRRAGPFVVFDCTAVAPGHVEAVLFGEEAGGKKGLFEQAHCGTLLLDEVADLDASIQAKILRAIERGEILRVGSATWLELDVRIIAATRRDLDREVQAGRFREDLFFRLAVGRVEVPPLRERTGDVALLASSFWRKQGGEDTPLPPELLKRWEGYGWPGNVRELANTVARRIAMGDLDDDAQVEDLRGTSSQAPPGEIVERVLSLDLPLGRARELVVEDFERRYVDRVLARHDGNVSRAAAASGLARRYFQILRARQNPKK
jgi:two-component system, NtrC family, response regulator HydG